MKLQVDKIHVIDVVRLGKYEVLALYYILLLLF